MSFDQAVKYLHPFALAWAPLARTTDPTTSHEAASEQIASGRMDTHAGKILAALRAHPTGLTFTEAAKIAEIENPVEAGRRLADLRDGGFSHTNGKRRCNVTGRKAQVWYPGAEEVEGVAA